MSTILSFAAIYKEMSATDKDALKEIKAEEEARTGRALTTREIIEAVTPGFDTPEYLRA